MFGLSAPKNIKKHQKIKIKKTRPKICCPVLFIFFEEHNVFSKSDMESQQF